MARVLFGGRLILTRSMGRVALVDAIAIALFVTLGELRHAGTVSAGVETFLQFLIGWAIAAVVFRAYTPRAISQPRRAAIVGVQSWVLAALLGQLIRMIADPLATFAPLFVLVSIGAGGVLVVGGRVLLSAR